MEPELIAHLADVISQRRDIRKFRSDPVDASTITALLTAAHQAPSVGLSQPWRFIVIRSRDTRIAARAIAQRHRLLQAPFLDNHVAPFLDQKVEGIVEAPVGICVCCVPPNDGRRVLGRATLPQTDLYSTSCAIQNLWLTARSLGLGIGWVSFYTHDEMQQLLGLPAHVTPVAWLCVGWPDERPTRPGLERAGWSTRTPLDEVVYEEHWPGATVGSAATPPALDTGAQVAARDREDLLLKPQGSLGVLEEVVERWSAMTGAPPPTHLTATHLVFAADHGHVSHGTSLFESAVTAQLAAAAARGETAIGVLSRARGEQLFVIDVGLAGNTPDGCVDASVRHGSHDFTLGPAMTKDEELAARHAGLDTVERALHETSPSCLVVGDLGIGNTTTSAALVAALLHHSADEVVGRGTGMDAAGMARKRDVVAAALARIAHDRVPQKDLPHQIGGLEISALVGALHAASAHRLPVILDGIVVSVAALIAVRERPATREWLIAGHRSSERAHRLVLEELGLEPLLDLRLRLGEGSGAALALPLIEAAGTLHRQMATYEEASVDGPTTTEPVHES